MKDDYTVEFRIPEVDTRLYFDDDVGVSLGIARKIVARPGDPVYRRVGEIHRCLRSRQPTGLFTDWTPHRSYSEATLARAECLRWHIPAVFEPEGEACGTVYDESTACPMCGSGRTQVGPLRLDLRKAPKGWDIDTRPMPSGKDVARTIADEIIVNERFAALVRDNGITGLELRQVEHYRKTQKPLPIWYQPIFTARPVHVVMPPTQFGLDPFDLDERGMFRCPVGHVPGGYLLTELTVRRADWDGSDIVPTVEWVGWKQGVLMPHPLLLVSPRFFRLMEEARIKGARVEIAHLA